mmetsp:Transcript_139342/g.445588  ORF Transcript_139342/g.445588 Transcript_139342/m.445588 type:complete len:327 (+) Transcript_139342:595-1575(+)
MCVSGDPAGLVRELDPPVEGLFACVHALAELLGARNRRLRARFRSDRQGLRLHHELLRRQAERIRGICRARVVRGIVDAQVAAAFEGCRRAVVLETRPPSTPSASLDLVLNRRLGHGSCNFLLLACPPHLLWLVRSNLRAHRTTTAATTTTAVIRARSSGRRLFRRPHWGAKGGGGGGGYRRLISVGRRWPDILWMMTGWSGQSRSRYNRRCWHRIAVCRGHWRRSRGQGWCHHRKHLCCMSILHGRELRKVRAGGPRPRRCLGLNLGLGLRKLPNRGSSRCRGRAGFLCRLVLRCQVIKVEHPHPLKNRLAHDLLHRHKRRPHAR